VRPADDDVDELLARGRLSGRQYDEIWPKVLSRIEGTSSRRRWGLARPLILLGALAGSAAGWALFAPSKDVGFAARGASGASGAFSLGCASSHRALCRPGETLMFSVNASVAHGHLGAYAERLDEPAHGRIWYFPGSDGGPVVDPGAATVVLPQGIELGPEQPAGRYRVTIWTAPQRISRTDGVSPTDGASSLAVLELEVAP
jgi:hypothetical protein